MTRSPAELAREVRNALPGRSKAHPLLPRALAALAELQAQAEAGQRETKERKLAHALVEHLQAQLTWEKKEHDKARDEWIIMRERLNRLHAQIKSARATAEPPDGWEPAWADYGDGLEADPYGWLDTLVAEAVADNPPALSYDDEATQALGRREHG